MGSIGDYYVALKQKVDKTSFQEGDKRIKDMETGLKKAGARVKNETNPQFKGLTDNLKKFKAGMASGGASTEGLSKALGVLESGSLGVLGVTGLLAGAFIAVEAGAFKLASSVGKTSQATLAQAGSTGLGIEALMKWHRAAQMIGMDAGTMDSTFASMRGQASQFKTWGELNETQLKNLAMLGEQQGGGKGFVDKWLGMNPEEKVRSVFQIAQGMKDVDKAALLINQTLGSSGESLFWSLSGRNMNLGKLLTDAKSLGMVTTGDIKRSGAFGDEMSQMGVILNEFKTLLGSELARTFMKPLGDFIDWYKNNKDSVRTTAQYVADTVGGPLIFASQGYAGWRKWTAKNDKERSSETPWEFNQETGQFTHMDSKFNQASFDKDLSVQQILSSLNNRGNAIDIFSPATGLNAKEANEQYGDVYYIDGAKVMMSPEEAVILKKIFVDPNRIGIKK
jgi:hypothetical protein